MYDLCLLYGKFPAWNFRTKVKVYWNEILMVFTKNKSTESISTVILNILSLFILSKFKFLAKVRIIFHGCFTQWNRTVELNSHWPSQATCSTAFDLPALFEKSPKEEYYKNLLKKREWRGSPKWPTAHTTQGSNSKYTQTCAKGTLCLLCSRYWFESFSTTVYHVLHQPMRWFLTYFDSWLPYICKINPLYHQNRGKNVN